MKNGGFVAMFCCLSYSNFLLKINKIQIILLQKTLQLNVANFNWVKILET